MTFFLLLCVLAVIVLVFMRPILLTMIHRDSRIVQKLQSKKWFQNQWLVGLFLFASNLILFGLVGFLLFYIAMYTQIPFLHLFIMLFGVVMSFYLWMVIYLAFEGKTKNRLVMSLIGHSLYLILFGYFMYQLVTLKPAFPGDDPFMAAIGLVFGCIVSFVAFTSGFFYTGVPSKSVPRS